MISTTISIRDTATPELQGILDRLQPGALNQVAGRAGANVYRTWFRNLNAARPNALGGKRTNFWAKAATAVGHEATDDGAVVYTNHTGVNYQRYGGILRPSGRPSAVTGRAIVNLAIPARSEAHGRLPSEFNNLVPMIRRRNGKPTAVALVEADSQDVKFGNARKDGTRKVTRGRERGGIVMYWLVKQARKNPDEDVFPPAKLVSDAAQLNLLDYAVRNARRLE